MENCGYFLGEHNNNVIDLSSFMLVEATGDSEADSSDSRMVSLMDLEEDDAESCCGFIVFELNDDLGNGYRIEDQKVMLDREYWRSSDSDEDEDEVVSNSENKSRICVDSAMEIRNERDRSRLFWEACLASSS